MQQYYYFVDNERIGPLSLEEIRQSPIVADTLVWCDGWSCWKPAWQVDELCDLFAIEASNGSLVVPNYTVNADANYDTSRPEEPRDYLISAILVTFFCFIPFGLVAIYFAVRAEDAYQNEAYDRAMHLTHKARKWVLITLITGVFWILATLHYGFLL